MQIPVTLRHAIENIAAGSGAGEIAAGAADISRRYRREDEARAASLQIRSAREAASYLAFRLPATFCAVSSVLRQVQRILPDFAPASLLDIGAGPATATLAALSLWPALSGSTLVEPNQYLREAGARLLRETYPDAAAAWLAQNLGGAQALPDARHDIVIMGYALNEIAQEAGEAALKKAVEEIWACAGHVLVIVEPGTPFGQKNILRAREMLLKQGARMIAPCPHEKPCPIVAQFAGEDRWCHFSVRVERSRLHKQAKQDATLGYEDEKFSYLAVSRAPAPLPQHRLVGTPRGKKVVNAEICRADGTIENVSVAKSSPLHKTLRDADWGDAF